MRRQEKQEDIMLVAQKHEISGFMTPIAIQNQKPRLLGICERDKHFFKPFYSYSICCPAIFCRGELLVLKWVKVFRKPLLLDCFSLKNNQGRKSHSHCRDAFKEGGPSLGPRLFLLDTTSFRAPNYQPIYPKALYNPRFIYIKPMFRLNSLDVRGKQPLEPVLNYRNSSPINMLRIDIPTPFGLKNRVSIQEGIYLVFAKWFMVSLDSQEALSKFLNLSMG